MAPTDGRDAGLAGEAPPGGRLIAVVVGIDRYADGAVPDLRCAANDAESVANALRLTQAPPALDLALLMSPPRLQGAESPTRDNVLAAVRRAAGQAGPQDTFLFYFAGHGGIIEGRPHLLPADAVPPRGEVDEARRSLLTLEQLQSAFRQSACTRRVMMLDCCQSSMAGAPESGEGQAPQGPSPSQPWRAGAAASAALVESFQQRPAGWSILLSCGANELSLEDPDWGEHGIFSHFLSVGLKGEADLDRDGVVSLAELVQYLANRVPKQARAVIEEMRERGETLPGQDGQDPTFVCGGPAGIPITRRIQEGRAAFDAGVLALWWRFLRRPLPYAITVEKLVRYGTALLYGGVMATDLLLFAPSPPGGLWLGLAGAALLISAGVWLAGFALAGAANERRWHSGGYVGALLALGWHAVVFGVAVAVRAGGGPVPGLVSRATFLGADLFVLISLMVALGYNELHCIISLADLLRRDERVALRRIYRQLDRRWINADVPNVIAMVSAHPRLYQLVGLTCSLVAAVHAGRLLQAGVQEGTAGLAVLRDVLLIVLVQWQVQWYAAAYRTISGKLLPEK